MRSGYKDEELFIFMLLYEFEGKVDNVLVGYLSGKEEKGGGWIILKIPSTTPEELITTKNEIVLFNKKDVKPEIIEGKVIDKAYLSFFMESIPEGVSRGKKVKIKIFIEDD